MISQLTDRIWIACDRLATGTVIARLLAQRIHLLFADVDAVLTHPPFAMLARDSDVEVLSEAWDDGAREAASMH